MDSESSLDTSVYQSIPVPEATPWQNLCDSWINSRLDDLLAGLFAVVDFEQLSAWMTNLPTLAGKLIDYFNTEIVPQAADRPFAEIIRDIETWVVNHVVHNLETTGRAIVPKAAADITPWDMLVAGQLSPDNAFLQFAGTTIPVVVDYNGVGTVHNLSLGFVAGLQAFQEAFGLEAAPFALSIIGYQNDKMAIPSAVHRMQADMPMLTPEDLNGYSPEIIENLIQLDSRPFTVTLVNGREFVGNKDFLDGLGTAGMWAGIPDAQIFTKISENGKTMKVAQ